MVVRFIRFIRLIRLTCVFFFPSTPSVCLRTPHLALLLCRKSCLGVGECPAFKCSPVIGTGNAGQDDQQFAYDNLRIYPLEAYKWSRYDANPLCCELKQPPHCPEQSHEQQYWPCGSNYYCGWGEATTPPIVYQQQVNGTAFGLYAFYASLLAVQVK